MKNIGIGTRILLITSVIILLLILSLSLISRAYLSKSYNKEIRETVKTRKIKFNDEIKNITQYALYSATICSELSFVKETYADYNNTNNFEESSAKLSLKVSEITQSLEKNTDLFLKIHYHLPPAKSFVRSWTEKKGDKLNVFRKSVVHISKYQSAIAGIELGRPGLLLRGLSPIFDKNSKYLGSVDVSFPFSEVFEKLYLPENESLAIYLQVRDYSNYKNDTLLHRVGSYVFNNSSSNQFNSKLISRKLFDIAISEDEAYSETDRYVQYIFPIYDFQDEAVALAVFQIDKTQYTELKFLMSSYLFLMGLLFLAIALVFLFIFIKIYVSTPLLTIRSAIQKIATGQKAPKLNFKLNDEISLIANDINNLAEYRREITELTQAIEKNEIYTSNLEYFNKNDQLSSSLLAMKDNLVSLKKREMTIVETNRIKKWTTEGFSDFNRIIREHSDLEKLSNTVLKELVEKLEANQGGIFIINKKNKEKVKFDLVASYAYDRKRFHEKEIFYGEGLIGMCAIEKETIHITELPDAYLELTSGLGKVTASSLLIIPLLQSDEVLGIIELASFNKFEDYKISFIEEVAKTISSSISMTTVNKQTQELLEETKFQAEQMAAQEEEMRQNMEELKATQEEMSKNEMIQSEEIENLNIKFAKKINELKEQKLEIESVFNALNTSTFLIEYDFEGNVIFVNDHVAELFGKERDEIIGRQYASFIQYSNVQASEAKEIRTKLLKGEIVKANHKLIINGTEIWLAETYTPIFGENGKPKKILKISYNITKEKEKEKELEVAMENLAKIKSSQSRTIDKIVKRAERKELRLKKEIQKLKNKN